MLSNILPLLCIFLYVEATSDDSNKMEADLDIDTFNQMLDAVFGEGSKEPEYKFWEVMKKRVLNDLLPEYIVVPAVEGSASGNKYFCATETRAYLKLEKTKPKGSGEDILFSFPLYGTKKIRFTINFQYKLTKNMPFYVTTRETSGNFMSPMSYSFTPGSVMFVLEIPDFSASRNDISRECLLRVQDVQVHEVGVPMIDNSVKARSKNVDHEFMKALIQKSYLKYFTAGIVKVLNERKNPWICSTEEIRKMFEISEKIWNYSDDYKTLCEGKKAAEYVDY